jgi:micrococcal nuclease
MILRFCCLVLFSLNLLLFAETVRVKKVLDGDSFVLEDDRQVRMLGIDTPEMSSDNPYARKARSYLQSRIEGRLVELERDPIADNEDRYGRLLRYVYVEGVDINREMIEKGFAEALTQFPLSRKREYVKLAEEASAQRIGIWQDREAIATGERILWSVLLIGALLTLVAIRIQWRRKKSR